MGFCCCCSTASPSYEYVIMVVKLQLKILASLGQPLAKKGNQLQP